MRGCGHPMGPFVLLDFIEAGIEIPSGALLAAVLTFFSAFAAIAFLMSIVKRMTFLIFMVYRLALAAVLFAMLHGLIPGYTLATPVG